MMSTNGIDVEARININLWSEEINTLLPQRETAAEQLFAAACSFLAWTRDFVHVHKIKQGRDAVCGIIRLLIKEGNLDPKTREIAISLLESRSQGDIALLKEAVGCISNAAP